MATKKQIEKWTQEAEKLNDNPKYVKAYIEYKQLAKRADQRLVKLEALSHEKHFEGVLEFAYKGAVRDIKSWGGDRRFNTAPPLKLTELEAKVNDIKKFIEKPTSTKKGMTAIYKKRADTINKRYGKQMGVKFTWQELANYYEDKSNKKRDMQLSSKTEVMMLAVFKKMNDKKLREIKDSNERIARVTGKDKILEYEAQKLFEKGITYESLMGGN